ncbi:ABC transporter ATP-binding protein [Myceligenerans cantabricum]
MNAADKPRAAAVETLGLRKTYTGVRGRSAAVDGLDLKVPARGLHVLLGPAKAGKSTVLRLLLGLAHADGGAAKLLGVAVPDVGRELSGRVGAVVGEPGFLDRLSGRRNLLMHPATTNKAQVDFVLKQAGLANVARDAVGSYSPGARRRLALAAGLLPGPDLLIADDPTRGLDSAGTSEVRTLLRKIADRGPAVLMTTDVLAEAQQLADTVTVLSGGRALAHGQAADVIGEVATAVRLRVDDGDRAVVELRAAGFQAHRYGDLVVADGVDEPAAVTRALARKKLYVTEMSTRRESLESLVHRLTPAPEPEPARPSRAEERAARREAERKAAEKKKAAAQRRADKETAAKKAAEEKAVAERKAAEEKAEAERRAAQEQAEAGRRAAKELTDADRSAAAERKVEEKTARKAAAKAKRPKTGSTVAAAGVAAVAGADAARTAPGTKARPEGTAADAAPSATPEADEKPDRAARRQERAARKREQRDEKELAKLLAAEERENAKQSKRDEKQARKDERELATLLRAEEKEKARAAAKADDEQSPAVGATPARTPKPGPPPRRTPGQGPSSKKPERPAGKTPEPARTAGDETAADTPMSKRQQRKAEFDAKVAEKQSAYDARVLARAQAAAEKEEARLAKEEERLARLEEKEAARQAKGDQKQARLDEKPAKAEQAATQGSDHGSRTGRAKALLGARAAETLGGSTAEHDKSATAADDPDRPDTAPDDPPGDAAPHRPGTSGKKKRKERA